VLATRAAVELQVLVDLTPPLTDCRLVQWEFDAVVAVRHDLRHQRGVFGRDVVADEFGHVHESHDSVVEVHPPVHLTQLDVSDAMVDRLEEPLALAGPRR
jgi:hypothetical protein